MTSVRVRRAAFVNSVRIKRDHDATSAGRVHGAGGVARREQLEERVLEPLRRHDRLEPKPGADQRGRDVGAAPVAQLDDEPVALGLHLRDARRGSTATRAARSRSSTST